MSAFTPQPYRAISLLQVFDISRRPVPQHLGSYQEDFHNIIQFQSHSFTLALNRNARNSTEIACKFALGMAKKYPEQRVLLINTYASPDLLQESFAKAFESGPLAMPAKIAHFRESHPALPELPNPMSYHFDRDIKKYETVARERAELAARYEPIVTGEEQTTFPNLRVLNFPTGTFNMDIIQQELGEGTGQIVIWNSFEFSAFRFAQRVRIAEAMIALQQLLHLSVLVFSSSMRRDIQAMTVARGAIGLISAHAAQVFRLMSESEWKWWRRYEEMMARISRPGEPSPGLPLQGEENSVNSSLQVEENIGSNSSKHAGNGTVHEQPMHSRARTKLAYSTPFSDYAAAVEERQKAVARGEIVPAVVRPF